MAKIEFHIYDLNLSSIRKRLLELSTSATNLKVKNKCESLISILDFQGPLYAEPNGIIYKHNTERLLPILIDPRSTMYHVFLQIQLAIIDVFKINSYLDYHFTAFEGNYYAKDKTEFVGMIQYGVYDKVSQNCFHECILRRQAIMNWVDSKRSKDQNEVDSYVFKEIAINEHFLPQFHALLKPYFDSKEHEVLEMLLKGNPIENPLSFQAPCIKLLDAFHRLHHKNLILNSKKNLESWICRYFKGQKRNEIIELTENYVHKSISSANAPTAKPIPGLIEMLNF